MRVLFTTQPGTSVFNTIVPLAWALRAAGHEVRVASEPGFASVITQAGLTAVPIGRSRNASRMVGFEDAEETVDEMGLPYPFDIAERPFPETTWERVKETFEEEFVSWWHKMGNFPLIGDLVAFARSWQPDLVIWEPLASAGAIAAKLVGAAHARILWSVDYFGVLRERYLRLQRPDHADALAAWLDSNLARYGSEFSEDLVRGQFTIDQLPDSLGLRADLHYLSIQHTPYGGSAVVPKWLWGPSGKPRVGLSLGQSIIAEQQGYAVNLPEIFDALSDVEIEVVATVAQSEHHKLQAVPDNVRVVPYVPMHALAPTCAAMIHHAGIGTMATVSLYGIPQLSLPFESDQPCLARRLAEQGAGLAVHARHATGEVVRENLVRLMRDPSFERRAQDLREEMRAMPTPVQLVGALEELTVKYRAG